MSSLSLYQHSLALLTDLYQLTMAYGYWKMDRLEDEAAFQLTFRKQPFQGGYSIACGLASVIEYCQRFCFSLDDVAYLATLKGADSQPLFEPAFLEYLCQLRLTIDLDALPEGTACFPHEPLLRVRGPLLQCQLLETPLLTLMNFQTLIATKAARICQAARGEPVLEFGLRRAQGIDGGVTASRAAYIGGCAATSNVLAGRLFDIPVKGTHAHSWVMAFDDELSAFRAYAEAMPNNCVFLVDTYDTLEGVRRAVEVGRWLREQGHEMLGIRLDSGDLAYLSIEARKILDAGGFMQAAIVASSDLDEHVISSLKEQGATIGVWGVGTRLATSFDQPALGGVYKLTALKSAGGAWRHKVKLSEQAIKVSTPGIHQVRRFRSASGFAADCIWDELSDYALRPNEETVMINPADPTRRKRISAGTPFEDLLVPILRGGAGVYSMPTIHDTRRYALDQLAALHGGIKRLLNPHEYPVGLEQSLHELKTRLILEARAPHEDA